jgi:phosphatidylglycerophosphate synthase
LTLATALLVIVPSGVSGVSADAPVAGLPLLRRIVLAAGRAGWTTLLAGPSPSSVERALAGASTMVLAPEGSIPARSPCRVLFLSMATVPQPEWLRRLLEIPLDPERLYVDGSAAALIHTSDPGRVLAAAGRGAGLREVVAALGATTEVVTWSLDGGGRFVLRSVRDLPDAETWLMRRLIKPNEGFMSRHFERRISLALTRRLCATGITPNAMTLVSLAIGLGCAPFFLSPAPLVQVAGALLFLTHSILDGCDGELARLKFLESRWGAILDIAGDNLVHTVVFVCMAVGWSRHAHSGWPLILGAIAVASTLSIAVIVYGRGMRASTQHAPASALSRVADVIVYRDFIYLILLLATAGKAHWFVAVTAVGAPVFLLLLLWLGRKA